MASLPQDQLDDLHFRVLRILEDSQALSKRDLATRWDVKRQLPLLHEGADEQGEVKLDRFPNSKDRLGSAYLLTPARITHEAGKFDRHEAARAGLAVFPL